MKNRKWLKMLLVLLAVVIMGVVFSCQSNPQDDSQDLTVDETETFSEEGDFPSDTDPVPEAGTETEIETETTRTESVDDICVHVCGSVVNPGVYYLSPASRMHEAVKAAGGLTEDAAADFVNLAAPVSDGEQIYIPSVSETEGQPHENPAVTEEETDKRVDINEAGEEELQTLPGIGGAKAKAIVSYRKDNGAFADIQDIKKVSGIGNALFEKIKDFIKV